ncbi:uncharacterized protein LOC131857400 [Cryptomeria japonica]|uniref:uncharacterized protein LOC131857400 n=1 Tax=Cryptomeria japonica TaxID=3369 RepID=UPI0027DA50D4|nr:uncharacterized protein LOC131857400 [Cryptomeria japonica]
MNEYLTKELADINEKLAKFNKSSTMLDEQIQSQRIKGDTTKLGYTSYEKGASSVPIGSSSGMKTRAQKEKVAKKDNPTKTKKEKPSKIQFKRKGKIVEPCDAPVAIGKRKKQQAQKPIVVDDEETEFEGEKKALRASGIRSKEAMKQDREYFEFDLKNLQPKATKEELEEILAKAKSSFRSKKRLTRLLIGETQSVHEETEKILKKILVLIPDEEEVNDELEWPKAENIPEGMKISDFELDEIMMGDDLGQEEKEDEEEKKEEEPPVVTQTADTQLPLVKANKEVKEKDNDKEKEKEKQEDEVEEKTKEKKGEEEKKPEDSKPKMKYFEDATYVSVEKEYKKQQTEQLMKDIDKGKVALTMNKDYLKEALETSGKILSIVAKFSLFCEDLKKKKEEAEKELDVICESFKPLNDSAINFG